ncbi:NAD(P)H-hydrate dehydratase [Spongorhabdus nitratireducens]
MSVSLSQGRLPVSLYRAEQVRRLDQAAIEAEGIDGYTLMQRAGQAAFDALLNRWPDLSRTVGIQIFCGAGNNGGDGYVVALLAHKQQIPARVIALADPETLQGEALQAYQDCVAAGVKTELWHDEIGVSGDVVVDAMLGTGLSGPIRGNYAEAIRRINISNTPVLALDIPSGLNADTGAEAGQAVRADLTITFVGMKQGLLTGAGPAVCGELQFAGLEIADRVYEQEQPAVQRLTHNNFVSLLPPRERIAHKGMHGHVLVLGGNHGMAGAAVMAAEAGLAIGAGKVTVGTQPEHTTIFNIRCPEIMAYGLDQQLDPLDKLLADKQALVVGPGLDKTDWSLQVLTKALATEIPMVLDADALNLIAEQPELIRNSTAPRVLTPHSGEAARLLKCTAAEVEADRIGAVREMKERYGSCVILKGAGSLVTGPSGIRLCCHGNPGMAVAGMGDVLSGIVGSLLAQGLEPEQAAGVAVWLHAMAGDECAAASGERGMRATDLVPYARKLINKISSGGW